MQAVDFEEIYALEIGEQTADRLYRKAEKIAILLARHTQAELVIRKSGHSVALCGSCMLHSLAIQMHVQQLGDIVVLNQHLSPFPDVHLIKIDNNEAYGTLLSNMPGTIKVLTCCIN